ncbi:MAG: hypothetical protein LBN10_11750 [Propionibacteriaceae bacterium]|jgi:CYTH domain-containing protein|nr:hypothetical protein [Propionibacteriaceae bacterium]
MLEIERRFLIQQWEPMPEFSTSTIWQGYLSIHGTSSIRIREVDENVRWLTVKSLPSPNLVLVRNEIEVEISADQFKALQKAVLCSPIIKKRTVIPLPSGLKIEVDAFCGNLDGLVIAEVEFSSLEESAEFVPPSWFGEEVTEDSRYINSSLAQHGIPDTDCEATGKAVQ